MPRKALNCMHHLSSNFFLEGFHFNRLISKLVSSPIIFAEKRSLARRGQQEGCYVSSNVQRRFRSAAKYTQMLPLEGKCNNMTAQHQCRKLIQNEKNSAVGRDKIQQNKTDDSLHQKRRDSSNLLHPSLLRQCIFNFVLIDFSLPTAETFSAWPSLLYWCCASTWRVVATGYQLMLAMSPKLKESSIDTSWDRRGKRSLLIFLLL